jgi:predicted lipid-binding transport protein (Tim44 family)
MDGDMAFVEVYIESEQINLLKDKKGKLLAGNENQMELVVDVWRFAKNVKDKNSLWILWETVENHEKDSCNP